MSEIKRELKNCDFWEKYPNLATASEYFTGFYGYLGRIYDYVAAYDLCDYYDKDIGELTEDDIKEASEGFAFYDWLNENHRLGERYDL